MVTYEEIKNKLIESGKLIYYFKGEKLKKDDDSPSLLVVASSKEEGRKELLKTGYQGIVYRLSITFHTGKMLGEGGPLGVKCTKFNVEGNEIKKIKDKQTGTYWFGQKWLEIQRQFKEGWLNIIAIHLVQGKTFGFGIEMYI